MADELRLQTITIQKRLSFITEACGTCGILFAMDEDFQKERVADKGWFYCPRGHQVRYLGKSDTQKLQEQLDEERRQRQRAEQRVAEKADEARAAWATATEQADIAKRERHRANGYKGHATRITKRAKAGVCPCCNRSFENLRRHMATKHPQFTPMELDDKPELSVIEGGKAVA